MYPPHEAEEPTA